MRTYDYGIDRRDKLLSEETPPTGNKALQIPCGLSSSVRQSRLSRLSVCHLPRRGRLTEPADRDKDNKKHKIFVISPVRKHPHPL